jgi:hypothetical protein
MWVEQRIAGGARARESGMRGMVKTYNMVKMRFAVMSIGFVYGCSKKIRTGALPRTPCLLCDSLRSPGAPRPPYRHLAIHIATRR